MALSHFTGGFGDDLFAPLFPGFPSGGQLIRSDASQSSRGIALDVVEKDKSFEVKADIPGVNKEDIKVSVDGDVLSLSVHKEQGKEENKDEGGVKYHRSERSTSFVRRALRMPQSADLGKIKAKYNNGVLQLEIPKTEEHERSRHIAIE